MATFTVDLFTGNVFLFSGDFSGSSGGTTPTSGSTYPEVNLFGELPSPNVNAGKIYIVRNSSGNYVLNRKESGLYFSNGSVWRRLGDTPSFFNSDNFQIYDGDDNTKGFEFDTSDVDGSIFRRLKIQNSDGTIAYLSDLNTKIDTSIFNDFTGTTAPNTYVTISDFNSYSGDTFSLIQNKQDLLVAGDGISIINNVISVTGLTINSKYVQLINNVGDIEVNTITSTPLIWTDDEYNTGEFSLTGGSRIYITEGGEYELSYVVQTSNKTNSNKNIGTLVRKNGSEHITSLTSTSYGINLNNNSGINTMPEYRINLSNGDYVELIAFRIGDSGSVKTVPNGSWFKINKKE